MTTRIKTTNEHFPEITSNQIVDILSEQIRLLMKDKNIVPQTYIFQGESGIGKSFTIHRLSHYITNCNIHIETYHLSNMQPEFLFGIPTYDEKNDFYELCPHKTIHEIMEKAENNKNDFFILQLEEANRADKEMINKLFQLVGSRKYNNKLLSNNIIIIMDINPVTSRAKNVAEMDAMFYRRCTIFEVIFKFKHWIEFATDIDVRLKNEKNITRSNIHPFIIEFFKESGNIEYINYIETKEVEDIDVIITPANWGMISDWLYTKFEDEHFDLNYIDQLFIKGILRNNIGTKFINFLYDKINDSGINIKYILTNFDEVKKKLVKYSSMELVDICKRLSKYIISNIKGELQDIEFRKNNEIDYNKIFNDNFVKFYDILPKAIKTKIFEVDEKDASIYKIALQKSGIIEKIMKL